MLSTNMYVNIKLYVFQLINVQADMVLWINFGCNSYYSVSNSYNVLLLKSQNGFITIY